MHNDSKVISILLVEDSQEDAFFFKRALSRCGIPAEVTLVKNGKAAADMLADSAKRAGFDIVFLDLKLPLLNGFEVLKSLRLHDPEGQLPVYVCSGSSQVKDQQKAEELGATGYLVKPVTRDVLQRVLPCLAVA